MGSHPQKKPWSRKPLPKSRKRVVINCLVLPSTKKLLLQMAKDAGSQGLAVDKAVAALAIAESFGKESLNVK